MTSTLRLSNHTVRGVSLGGVYTCLGVPELGLMLDVGMPLRGLVGLDTWLISHGHADHIGALPAMLGIRGLMGRPQPPTVIMPAEIVDDVEATLAAMSRMQRYDLAIKAVGLRPGDRHALRGDLEVQAIRTFHPVPSLAYLVVRQVARLDPQFHGLPGPAIAKLRAQGVAVTRREARPELAYVTDTLVSVFDYAPELGQAQTLIMETTFLDERKSLEAARQGCHIHLDELAPRVALFANAQIVMMHFSQLYQPREVPALLAARLPEGLRSRVQPLLPADGVWPGT